MKAIIAAAWYGTRMLPITKVVPKELLPVWTKPVIHYIVEGIKFAGINDIVIITSNWKQALEDYFDKNYELEFVLKENNKIDKLNQINQISDLANICFVRQKEQLGFAHAILAAEPWIDEDYFLLSVWDTIFDYNIFKDIVEIFKKKQTCVVALKQVPYEEVYKLKIENDHIVDMIEKPDVSKAPSNLIMIWLYILPKRIFNIIKNLELDPDKKEYLLPDALKVLIENWEKIIPYISEYNIRDTWNVEWFVKANIDFLINLTLNENRYSWFTKCLKIHFV